MPCTFASAAGAIRPHRAIRRNAIRSGAAVVRNLALALAGIGALAIAGPASAQATAGRASSIVIPTAVKTASYETEVFVRNPGNGPATLEVDVLYYEANNLPSPGLKACNFLSIPQNSNVSFKLATQCPSLATGSHFGLLVLRDRAAEKTNSFAAFSRVQHVASNQGFSIEGFPEHVFSGRGSGVIGLKRIAGAVPPTFAQPGWQANCFVGSLGESVSYSIQVREGSDSSIQVGNTLTGTLGPYQLFRWLDILTAVGFDTTQGDKQNFRVVFDNTDPVGEPAYIGFCTEQDNYFFGADFRIAKSDDEANITKLLTRCRGTSDAACTTLTSPASYAIPNASTKHRFSMFIHHPDYLRCDVVGPNAANLEIQLMAPATAGQPTGPSVAGGNDASGFYYASGPRNAPVNSGGFQLFWTLEVGPREGPGAPGAFPVDYGIKCVSGSGIHIAGGTSNATDDF